MDNKVLKERTKKFAHRCVKLAISLPKTILGNHLSGQLIRCSTSVASNYRASCLAQTKPSFISKLTIVIEEADESEFWLQFIIDERLIKDSLVLPILNEANELASIFIASRKTSQSRK